MAEDAINGLEAAQAAADIVISSVEEFKCCCCHVDILKVLLFATSLLFSITELGTDFWAYLEFRSINLAKESKHIRHLTNIWIICQGLDTALCISKIVHLIRYFLTVRKYNRTVSPDDDVRKDFEVEQQTLEIWALGNGIFGFVVEDFGINVVKTSIAFQSLEATTGLKVTSAKVSSAITLVAAIAHALLQCYLIYKLHTKGRDLLWSRYLKSFVVIFITGGAVGPVLYSFGISYDIVEVHHDNFNDFKLNFIYLVAWTVSIPVLFLIIVAVSVVCKNNICKRQTNAVSHTVIHVREA